MLQTLERKFAVEITDYDIAVVRPDLFLDDQQVAVENAVPLHTAAVHPRKKCSRGIADQQTIQVDAAFQKIVRGGREARRYAAARQRQSDMGIALRPNEREFDFSIRHNG